MTSGPLEVDLDVLGKRRYEAMVSEFLHFREVYPLPLP